jgi:hypothetical protein
VTDIGPGRREGKVIVDLTRHAGSQGETKTVAGNIRTDPSGGFKTAPGGRSCCSAITAVLQVWNSAE